jgi:hypothetical protein
LKLLSQLGLYLAENVSGMLAPRHKDALENIKSLFTESNYNLSFLLLNAVDYGYPKTENEFSSGLNGKRWLIPSSNSIS